MFYLLYRKKWKASLITCICQLYKLQLIFLSSLLTDVFKHQDSNMNQQHLPKWKLMSVNKKLVCSCQGLSGVTQIFLNSCFYNGQRKGKFESQ